MTGTKTKVILRVNTVGARRGDEIEVDKETAESLIANGHARSAKSSPGKGKD